MSRTKRLPPRQAEDYARESTDAADSSEPPPTRRGPPPPAPARRATRPRPTTPPAGQAAPAEQSSAEGEPAKVPPLITLDAVADVPIAWLWPGWIPAGMLSLCDGLPGEGKSTMLVDIAARVTTGREMPDGTPGGEPGNVLFLGFEDPAPLLRSRFRAAGADLSRVSVHHPESDDLLRLGKGSPLETWIVERGAKLVIVDPLINAVPGSADMHRGQDARRILAPVGRIAERTGAAIIGVRHFTKGEGRSALLRGEGSIGIAGTARSVFVVARDPDEAECRVLAPSKSNLGPLVTSRRFALLSHPELAVGRVEWRGESRYTADDLTGPTEHQPQGREGDAVAFLRDALADGGRPATEIAAAAKAARIASRTLDRARAKLGVVPRREGGRSVLYLPEPAQGEGIEGEGGQHGAEP